MVFPLLTTKSIIQKEEEDKKFINKLSGKRQKNNNWLKASLCILY